MSKWARLLLDTLRESFTRARLRDAGASKATAAKAITAAVEIPSLAPLIGPPPNILESRELIHLHPTLRVRYEALALEYFRITGHQLFPTCTWRSVKRQKELYAKGRRGIAGEKIVTRIDGVNRRSRHNHYPALGIDVCVDMDPGPGKHAAWAPELYAPLGPLAKKHGLRWGGDWDGDGVLVEDDPDESLVDKPHLELHGADL